jgi:hypothetical protein
MTVRPPFFLHLLLLCYSFRTLVPRKAPPWCIHALQEAGRSVTCRGSLLLFLNATRSVQSELRHTEYMVSYWGNPDYDTALLLTMATGNLTTNAAQHLRDYIDHHVVAEDGYLSCDPPPTSFLYSWPAPSSPSAVCRFFMFWPCSHDLTQLTCHTSSPQHSRVCQQCGMDTKAMKQQTGTVKSLHVERPDPHAPHPSLLQGHAARPAQPYSRVVGLPAHCECICFHRIYICVLSQGSDPLPEQGPLLRPLAARLRGRRYRLLIRVWTRAPVPTGGASP